jgi:ring-1,2-phenylacetyl-CoA epoxidase subunit PaaD
MNMDFVENDTAAEERQVWSLLEKVMDPEIPVLSAHDLGIIRKVTLKDARREVEVEVTPTYSGCPAMDIISMNIRNVLYAAGYSSVKVKKVLFPAWTTAWMSEAGKEKLKAFGIAPPGAVQQPHGRLFQAAPHVQCPMCNSINTQRISEFGSTSCKSLYKCNDCLEPFDAFKCH